MSHFVGDLGVGIVGGCCGTHGEHISKLAEISEQYSPKRTDWEYTPAVSSIYTSVPMIMTPAPLMVGERCNANGSKKFKQLLEKNDYDSMVNMAKEQIKEGAHVLDVCVAFVGRDEAKDMEEVMKRFNTAVSIPLVIDSTEVNVIEVALKNYAGKAIINSINFEDGTEKADKILELAKKYGAAVIVLSIDEKISKLEKKIQNAQNQEEEMIFKKEKELLKEFKKQLEEKK